MRFEYFQFPYLEDNYGVLIHAPNTGETALIDAGDSSAALAALKQKGWELTEIWITHHHWDHTQDLGELKKNTGAQVIGPDYQGRDMIEGLDLRLHEGMAYKFAGKAVQILHTPGHTLDMINFYIPDDGVVFAADTLFPLGCGRIFEGTAKQMWQSLQKLKALPPETLIYAGHEYSQANACFALTIEPENIALQARAREIVAQRNAGQSTLPSKLADELKTNPFLRTDLPAVKAALGMEDAADFEVFGEMRRRKDNV